MLLPTSRVLAVKKSADTELAQRRSIVYVLDFMVLSCCGSEFEGCDLVLFSFCISGVLGLSYILVRTFPSSLHLLWKVNFSFFQMCTQMSQSEKQE